MINIKCDVKTYPDSLDKDSKIEKIIIENHWNCDDRVNITIGDKTVIVLGKDIIKAISNCMNNSRF